MHSTRGIALAVLAGLVAVSAGCGGGTARAVAEARVALGAGRVDDAERVLEQARASSETPEVLLALGDVRLRQGRIDEAAALARQVLSHEPKLGAAHALLGKAAHRAGRLGEAHDALRAAVGFDVSLLDAHLELGLVLAELERREDAIVALKRGLRANLHAPAALSLPLYLALGRLYEAARRFEDGRLTFVQAAELEPRSAAALAGQGRCLRELGRLDPALDVLRRAATLAPSDAEVQGALAAVYLDYSLASQALAAARKAVQLEPRRAEYHTLLLAAQPRETDATDEGFAALERAAAVLSSDLAAQKRLGAAATTRKSWLTAESALRRAIALAPGDVDANFGLGVAQLRRGELPLARDAVAALVRLDPARAAELQKLIDAATPKPKPAGRGR